MKNLLFLTLALPLFFCSKKVILVEDEKSVHSIMSTMTFDTSIVKVYSAPTGADTSTAYQVSVQGLSTPVYKVKVAPEDDASRWLAIDDRINTHLYYNTAAFAYFDMNGPVTVTVTMPSSVSSAKVLPLSAGITPGIIGNQITFTVATPQNLTIEVDGEWVESLHLFANPFEINVPSPTDPNVIYYGPGIHTVSKRTIGDNKTLYIAGGAIVRAIVDSSETFTTLSTGLRRYDPTFYVRGNNIKVRGRGILDASACPNAARNMFYNIVANNYSMEGIILQNASTWTMPIYYSNNVTIDNIKIMGYRSGTDGIDICNSVGVNVKNCFIRTLDDLVVVKTQNHATYNVCKDVVVEKNVLWNQAAHALSVGAEIIKPINNITFKNCDVIHDQGREWSLRVFHTDSAMVSNVKFEDIRIAESNNYLSLWIKNASWSTTTTRGNIRNVTFKDISLATSPRFKKVELLGFDATHKIDTVLFQNVRINNIPIVSGDVTTNAFVSNITIL
jgi:hypothetical protein